MKIYSSTWAEINLENIKHNVDSVKKSLNKDTMLCCVVKSNAYDCKNCIYVKKCTNSKTNQKILTRHIWQDYIEEANHLRYKTEVKKIYQKRKETIERVFADAKEKHGMRYTKL